MKNSNSTVVNFVASCLRLWKIVVFATTVSACSGLRGEGVEVRFGYIKEVGQGEYEFLREANIVAIIPRNYGVFYGVRIDTGSSRRMSARLSAQLPDGSKVDFPEYNVESLLVVPVFFEPGDLEGKYSIYVEIDGRSTLTIEFIARNPKAILSGEF